MAIAAWGSSKGGSSSSGGISKWAAGSAPSQVKAAPVVKPRVVPVQPKLNPYSVGNVASGAAHGAGHGIHLVGSAITGALQSIPRGVVELGESLQPTTNAKAPAKPNNAAPTLSVSVAKQAAPKAATPTKTTDVAFTPSGRAAQTIFGKAPVTSIQKQTSQTESSHQGGFHIKGTPITLTPRELGAVYAPTKSALDATGAYGAAKAPFVAAGRIATEGGVKGAVTATVKGGPDLLKIFKGGPKTVDELAHHATVANGGVTIDTKGNIPTKGYAFAPTKGTEVKIPTKELTPQHFSDYSAAHADELAKPGNHIGAWSNPEDGMTYLDISRVGEPAAKTVAAAHSAKQLSIYDLEHGNTIDTGQIGKNGVYSKYDTPSRIHNQYQRQISRTGGPGNVSGAPEVPQDVQPKGNGNKQTAKQAQAAEASQANPSVTGVAEPKGAHNVGGERSILEQAPTVQAGDKTRQAVLNQRFVQSSYRDFIKPVRQAAKNMSAHDKQLLDTIEGNHKTASAAAKHLEKVIAKADNPAQFRAVHDAIRSGYDARLASDLSMGREVGRRNNYLQHIFDRRDPNVERALDKLQGPKTIIGKNTPPGYTKPRTVPSYEAAGRIKLTDEAGKPILDARGKAVTLLDKRKNANALEDFEDAMRAAANEHGSQALRRGIEEAHGINTSNKVGFDKLSGKNYVQLRVPGGENITVPKDIADHYNQRLGVKENPGVTKGQKIVKGYDAANRGLKYAKLGGGFFHSFTTAGSVLGRQVTSLHTIMHPIEALKQNLNLIKSTVSTKAFDESIAGHAASGRLSFARKIGTTLSPQEILADADVKKLDKIEGSRWNPIKKVHDLVFSRQIPEAKMMFIQQKMDMKFPGMDYHNPTPAQMAYGRKVATSVNRLGGINRAVSGLTYPTAQRVARVVLATDFTEGKFGTLYAALAKAPGNPEGDIARSLVVGKTVVFALPGVAAATIAGKIHTRADLEHEVANQILNPNVPLKEKGKPSKTNPQGTPQEAKLPKTFISEIASVIAPAISDLRNKTPAGGDLATGVKDYASARLAALPSTVEQAATNTDFYGNPIYGPDKQGNPQSKAKVAQNIGNQVLPIPAVQTSKTISGGQNVRDAALNTVGFKISNNPQSAEGQQSAAVNKRYNAFNPVATRKSTTSKQISDLISQGKVNQAMKVATNWNNSLTAIPRGYEPDNISPEAKQAWDAKWNSLKISVSPRSITTRIKNNQANANLLK